MIRFARIVGRWLILTPVLMALLPLTTWRLATEEIDGRR